MTDSTVTAIDTSVTVADLRRRTRAWRNEGRTVAMVPTMGALHEGHLSLVRRGLELADRVVVSIFVNPKQFGPNEDYLSYPRRFSDDCLKVARAGGALVYAPTVEEMYPQGFSTAVTVEGVSRGLCGDARPGHFQGVATVVTKLLLQCLPDVAIFGEKDYQQLQVIRRTAIDLDIPVRIEGCPTAREADGLALSSRNAYLSAEERTVAPRLHQAIEKVAEDVRAGLPAREACARAEAALREVGFDKIDYLEVRDAASLAPVEKLTGPARVFVAAFLGRTRLIDNVPV